MPRKNQGTRPHVVILGAGFGGIKAAKLLADKDVNVTIVDKHNYHLFQPLLYKYLHLFYLKMKFLIQFVHFSRKMKTSISLWQKLQDLILQIKL